MFYFVFVGKNVQPFYMKMIMIAIDIIVELVMILFQWTTYWPHF